MARVPPNPSDRVDAVFNRGLDEEARRADLVGIAAVREMGYIMTTDAMTGDAALFAREDYVKEAWRIADPVPKVRAFLTRGESSERVTTP